MTTEESSQTDELPDNHTRYDASDDAPFGAVVVDDDTGEVVRFESPNHSALASEFDHLNVFSAAFDDTSAVNAWISPADDTDQFAALCGRTRKGQPRRTYFEGGLEDILQKCHHDDLARVGSP